MKVALVQSTLVLAVAARLHGRGDRRHDINRTWAGVVTDSKNVNHVTGTIVVPSVTGGTESDCTSFWVGIDGDHCDKQSIEQLGIDVCGDGSIAPWFEWYPDDNIYRRDFVISAGDSVRFTVDASSTNSGTGYIDNLTTGQSINHTWTNNANTLCEKDADWIVEDFGEPPVPYVNFGSVTFTDASAKTADGNAVMPSDGEVLTMADGSTVMTSCTLNNNDVTCTWQSNGNGN